MAISTITTLNDLLQTETIQRIILDAARAAAFMPTIVWNVDLTGSGSLTHNFPRFAALAAAASTENQDTTPSTLTTDQSATLVCAEAVCLVEVSKLALAASGGRIDEQVVGRQVGLAMADLMETDATALFASFSSAVGASGVNLSLANIRDALVTLRIANAPIGNPGDNVLPAPLGDSVNVVLHEQQFGDFLAALESANLAFHDAASLAIVTNQGGVPAKLRGRWNGLNFWASTTCATANGGADRVGAMFVPAAIGFLSFGGVELSVDDRLRGRSVDIMARAIYEMGIVTNSYGVEITTDA